MELEGAEVRIHPCATPGRGSGGDVREGAPVGLPSPRPRRCTSETSGDRGRSGALPRGGARQVRDVGGRDGSRRPSPFAPTAPSHSDEAPDRGREAARALTTPSVPRLPISVPGVSKGGHGPAPVAVRSGVRGVSAPRRRRPRAGRRAGVGGRNALHGARRRDSGIVAALAVRPERGSIRPVLKHGPRSLARTRVEGGTLTP